MSSEIKADKWSPASGTSATIGDSGDTFTVPSGVTLDTSSSTLSLPSSVITGQTEKTSLVDADKFLISDSAASGALKYVQKSNLPSGAFTYINGTSSTSEVSALTLDSVFSSSYQNYLIVFGITVINGASGRELRARVRHGGTTVTGSEYHTTLAWFDTQISGFSSINYPSSNSNNATSIQVGGEALSNSSNLKTCSGTIFLYDMNKSDEYKTMLIDNVSQNWSGYTQRNIAVGQYLADQAIDGITFFADSDNLKSGYFRVYGIADS